MIVSDKKFRLLIGRDELAIVSFEEIGSMDISAGRKVGDVGQPASDLAKLEHEESRAIKRIRRHGLTKAVAHRPFQETLAALKAPKIAGYAVELGAACEGKR